MKFLSGLTLILITLKLTHFIDWSWWVILAPAYILPLILLSIAAFSATCLLILNCYQKFRYPEDYRKQKRLKQIKNKLWSYYERSN